MTGRPGVVAGGAAFVHLLLGLRARVGERQGAVQSVLGPVQRLLALFQPMATDLRSIVAALKINTDLERVGDLAVNIAEAAKRYVTHPPVKRLIDIPRMADLAQSMLRAALDAYVKRDTTLAQSVLDRDDELDSLKTQVFRELLTYMLQDPATIEPSLDLVLQVGGHRERARMVATFRRGTNFLAG